MQGDISAFTAARGGEEIADLIARGDHDTALVRMMTAMTALCGRSEGMGRWLFVPVLDALLGQIGEASRHAAGIREIRPARRMVVQVATQIFATGGHSRLIEDIVRLLPAFDHVVVLTNLHGKSSEAFDAAAARLTGLGARLVILPKAPPFEQTRLLRTVIADFAPRMVLALQNRSDAVAMAAIDRYSAPITALVHIHDHGPCFGATRRDIRHLDVSPTCHLVCGRYFGAPTRYLGLTVTDQGHVEPRSARASPVAAISGQWEKFEPLAGADYFKFLDSLFSAGIGHIHHFGPIPRAELARFGAVLIQPGRKLTLRDWVPSLAAALRDLDPDVYVGSYPIPGAKATVEALSAGLPILSLRPPSAFPLLDIDMTLGESFFLSNAGELPAALALLGQERVEHCRRSRAVYEQHYSEARFRAGLEALVEDA